ncbi:MAG: hypothetical protein IPP47_21295 [Bryobacterales bacterium]|nr:hypothetical protein [Bryobacterales bacterium]
MHEPESLIDLGPDCPHLLAQIVHRALHKDLEFRYTGFQDLLTDLDPVLMELRRAEADDWFQAAQQAVAEDRVEQAKAALARVLELVPDRKEARGLLEQVKDRQRQSAVRVKVEAFILEAEQKPRTEGLAR